MAGKKRSPEGRRIQYIGARDGQTIEEVNARLAEVGERPANPRTYDYLRGPGHEGEWIRRHPELLEELVQRPPTWDELKAWNAAGHPLRGV